MGLATNKVSATQTSDEPIFDEKIEFKGNIEMLSLLVRLMINHGLIEGRNSKSKISRVLAKAIETETTKNLSSDSLLKKISNNKYIYEPKNIERLQKALSKMTAEAIKLQ